LDGNYAGAIKKVVGLNTPWIDGAAFLVRKGYLEECLFCCERELDENPDSTSVLELRASCLSDLGRFSEAIEAFDDLLKREEVYLFAILGKGFALMGLERYEDALPFFDRVMDADHGSQHAKTASMYKGMALYLLGRYDEALNIRDFREEFVERFKESVRQKKARGGMGKDPFGRPGASGKGRIQ
jgi:tetratricopeptide (TPR) repeat protein